MGLALILGGVGFQTFEIPQELPGIGGTQTVAKKEFPGGDITQQELGGFPNDISWKGYFTGGDAFARQQAIDGMRAAGSDVTMSYGPYAWIGKILKFDSKAKHQFLVEYDITFSPSKDLSAASQLGSGFLSLDSILSTAISVFDDVATTAGDDSLIGFSNGVAGGVGGVNRLALPYSLNSVADDLITTVNAGLQDGNGTVASLTDDSLTAIGNAGTALSAATAPFIAGDDATQSSPALDLAAYAGNIVATANGPSSIFDQFTTINPNLFNLAQTYYGDAGQWWKIANASGISDAQPIGQITITIPGSV